MAYLWRRYSRHVWAILATSACVSIVLLLLSGSSGDPGGVGGLLLPPAVGVTPPPPQHVANSLYQDNLVVQQYHRHLVDSDSVDVVLDGGYPSRGGGGGGADRGSSVNLSHWEKMPVQRLAVTVGPDNADDLIANQVIHHCHHRYTTR